MRERILEKQVSAPAERGEEGERGRQGERGGEWELRETKRTSACQRTKCMLGEKMLNSVL